MYKKFCLCKTWVCFQRLDIERVALHVEKVEGEKPVIERFAATGDELDDFGRFDAAYDTRCGAYDTGRSAPRREGRAVGKELGIAFPPVAVEYRYLSAETFNTSVDIGLFQAVAPVVDKVACGIVVAAVDDDVVGFDGSFGILFAQEVGVGINAARTVPLGQGAGCMFDLALAGLLFGIENLPLQVAFRYGVAVDKAYASYPGRTQVEGDGRAQPADTHNEYRCPLQSLLTRDTYLGQHDLAGVTFRWSHEVV